jgi:enterochelin esterase family protein
VVRFVKRYRARPGRVADRLFISCGVYEDWESWRDLLRDGLSWIFPGEQLFVYE